MKEIILAVEGMKCSMCESHVNDAVRRAADVKKVESSHSKGCTTVVCDDAVGEEKIKAAIEALGYGVESVESRPYEKKGFFSRFKK